MNARLLGIIRILSTLFLIYSILFALTEVNVAIILTAIILLYGWLGEYISLFQLKAIKFNKLSPHEQNKLSASLNSLAPDVERISNVNLKNLKLHIVPSDDFNAYACGYNNIAISRGVMNNCDPMTLNAILSHEISHIIHMDAIFNRLIVACLILISLLIGIISFFTTSIIWILFILLIMLGVFRGFLSYFAVSGTTRLIRSSFSILQRFIISVFNIIMSFISKISEYRCDKYAVILGYGTQLYYFLRNYAQDDNSNIGVIENALYGSHPATYKRLKYIEKIQNQS